MARAGGLSGPVPPRDGPEGDPTRPGGGSAGGRSGRPGSPRRRRPGRLRLIVAGFLLLVLAEILLLIAAFRTIGPWWTIGLLLLFTVLGAVLVRRESGRTWRALRQAVDSGLMPGRELADASLVLVGGLFLLLPGLLSDLLGIFLILPMTRSLSRRLFAAVIGSRVVTVLPDGMTGRMPGRGPTGPAPGTGRPGGSDGDIIEGEIVSEDPPPEH